MNLQLQVNRIRIALNALFCSLRKKQINGHSKKILIVFQQVFGDAVVLSNSLQEYERIYPKSEGYQITLLARPVVKNFMESVLPIPESISLEPVDFKRFIEDYSYYKEVLDKYQNFADIIIVPGTSLSAEVFSAACVANNKISLLSSTPVKRPFFRVIFYQRAYTHKVKTLKEDMMLQRHRRLINYLGDKEYKAKLPELLVKEKIIDEERYCVVCLGASKKEKCWPIDRFAKVADYIHDQYGMKVHLCGGADEEEYENLILSQVENPGNIVSHIGKTSFSDWSAIVQHAELVLGNDSATMHLAAASRRKAICMAGIYDKYQFFPYKVDELDEGDRLPVTLIKDMPCEWCRTIGYFAGYGNPECKARIRENLCSCCIDLITIEDVIEQIDKLMR